MRLTAILAFLILFNPLIALAGDCDDLNDQVYFNLPMRSLTLITTLPSPFAKIPVEPSSTKSEEPGTFSVQCKKVRNEIEGIWIFGKYLPLKEARAIAVQAIENTLREEREHQAMPGPDKGEYLYRAPQQDEWLKILKDGYYTIPTGINFERDVPASSGEAGIILRFAVPGPFYSITNEGKRITSFAPHYVKVDVLDGDRWLSVDGYRVRHNIADELP